MSLEISAETSFALDLVNSTNYSSEYLSVLNAMTNKPTSAIADAQNTMVASLVSAGIWGKLDGLWVLANNTEANSYINWINPGTFDITNGGGGGITFTAYEGWLSGGAVGDYLNLNYNPTTDAVNVTTTSFSMGVYSRTDAQENNAAIGSRSSGPDDETVLYLRDSGDLCAARICQDLSAAITIANSSSLGLHSATRTGTTNNVHKGTTHGATVSVAEGGFSNLDMYVCAYNNNGSPGFDSGHQLSMAFIGSYLSDGELETLETVFEIYMDSNGKGVL